VEPSAEDDLLAIVAHSLLNSIAVISGSAQLALERGPQIDPDDLAESLERIVRQAEHVGAVLTDLVRSGRPELVATLDALDGLA